MNIAKMPRHLRIVGLGLALSTMGGLGLVSMATASAQDAGDHEGARPPMHERGEMRAGGPRGMMMGPLFGPLPREIKVTDAQREQLHKIAEAAREDMRKLHEANKGEHEQMMKLFTAANVDVKAVEALRSKLDAERDAESKRMTQAMIDASKVLTAEQRVALGKMMSEHRPWGGPPPGDRDRMGPRGPMGHEHGDRDHGPMHDDMPPPPPPADAASQAPRN
jgi:periplasmic protein CpxP/Spy